MRTLLVILAAAAPHAYILHHPHHQHCRHAYTRQHRHHHVWCVPAQRRPSSRPATPQAAPSTPAPAQAPSGPATPPARQPEITEEWPNNTSCEKPDEIAECERILKELEEEGIATEELPG